jgi:hypothetical protein
MKTTVKKYLENYARERSLKLLDPVGFMDDCIANVEVEGSDIKMLHKKAIYLYYRHGGNRLSYKMVKLNDSLIIVD